MKRNEKHYVSLTTLSSVLCIWYYFRSIETGMARLETISRLNAAPDVKEIDKERFCTKVYWASSCHHQSDLDFLGSDAS